jgi:hypothetical protein
VGVAGAVGVPVGDGLGSCEGTGETVGVGELPGAVVQAAAKSTSDRPWITRGRRRAREVNDVEFGMAPLTLLLARQFPARTLGPASIT